MSDRGKHHGQPLKAKEVLRLYAAGERDFRGTILRGCSFRNADLSAANFTGADIRSARFINANLQKAAFCYARGGLQRRWMASQIALIIVIAALAGSLQGFAGYVIGFYFNTGGTADFIAAIASTILVAFTFFAIAQQGFTIRALGSIAFAVAVTVTVAVAVVVAIAGTRTEAISMAFNLAVSCAFAGAVAGAGAFVGTGAVAVAFAVSDAVAVSGAIAFGIAVAVASAFAMVGAVAFVVAAASLLLSLYVNRCICRDAPKFRNLHVIGQAFAALGGTNFSGADLMGASFAHAHLKSVSFADSLQQSTILDRVRWHQGQKLDRARLGTSNLQDPRVRQLLVTLNGVDQDLSNADLRGANLAGNTALQRIILKGANLNGATLAGAALHEANLTETQCVGANFTRAQLTGACLEAWNIDETTILKDVDCEYVFLKEKPDRRGNRERRPHNPNKVFEPGDFEKFFKEMLDTVQILIRQGIYPHVFKETLEQLMANYDLSADAIQGFEKKGKDVLVTVTVPEGTDKGQFEQDFDELQTLKLEAARTQGLLEGERKRADELKAIMLSLGPAANTVTVTTTAMTHSNNPHISATDGSFVNTGDQMQGNVVNLGELSGQVSVQINQLPDTANCPDRPSLKEMLSQIQQAVEADSELSEMEKKQALQSISNLAEAGTKPQDNAMQRVAKRAAANLRAITEPLIEGSNLAAVCQKLLPMILTLF